ncbi:MAG: membrane fusion protein (multidrug efflux system) [Polaribacter sp.]|jgi:membrane fusion protein (multidrug efflux system)
MRLKPWLIVVAICVGIVVVLGFIKFIQIRAAIAFGESFPEPSETVEIQTVEFSAWQAQISVIGEVRASREVVLRNEIEGVIAKIGFQAGGEVEAGDILLQLDIGEEQASLEAIAPQIKLAQLDLQRISGLRNRQAVSQQDADRAAAELAVAQGQRASVKEAIANKSVVAPFDGFAGLHDFEVGEFIPSNTVIADLVGDLDTLWIDFSVPQKHSGLSSKTLVLVEAPQFSGDRLSATILAVEPSISSQSRSLKVRAVFDNTKRLLKPGHIVNVFAPVAIVRKIVRLPNTAVRLNAFGAYVFALNKDKTNQWRASRRPITVLAKQGYDSIIGSGLQAGDVVATTGSFKLREGLLVHKAKAQQQSEFKSREAQQTVAPTGIDSGN